MKNREQGNNQKLMLFNLGKAISGAPIIIGKNMLPNPPIKTGITNIKIIIIPCIVTRTLNAPGFSNKKAFEELESCTLIRKDIKEPIIAEKKPNTKYSWPISL